ncbi:hypothetical protein [Lewinella sp. 4G2]|uniref:hypothetical protein n=1 Tax=Lewinella sp. 4G2 TaxID=1803372 RepID=UPI0007B4AEF3|nr:hypothetical protein [Lewinella sp. 4G2]OAV45629.1 hypothetical protein A3850_014505 [Lewinella sp. 4G2]
MNTASVKFLLTLSFMLYCCLLSDVLNGQRVTSITANRVVVCDTVGGRFQLSIDNGATAVNDASLQVRLGLDVEYIPGSLVQMAGPMLEFDPASDGRAPIFNIVETWAPGQQISFSIGKQGGCAARESRINNELFIDTIRLLDGAAMELPLNGQDTVPFNVIYAELTTSVLATDPPVITQPQDTVTRRVQITNGSFGFLREFTFGEIDSTGQSTYANFVLDPDGAAVPLGDGIVNGLETTVTIDSDDMVQVAGFTGGLFRSNRRLTLEYDVIVSTCSNAGITSFPYSQYDCFGEVCQGDTTIANIGNLQAQPDVSVDVSRNYSFCYGYDEAPDTTFVTLINSGDGPATDLSVLYRVARTETSALDTMNINYRIGQEPLRDIAAAEVFDTRGNENTNLFGCEDQEAQLGLGNLANFGFRVNFPDTLAAGDTLTLRIFSYKCCPEDCIQDPFYGFLRFGGANTNETDYRYNNLCRTSPVIGRLPGYSSFFTFDNNVTLPTTFFVGDTFPARIDFPRLGLTADFPFDEDSGYLEILARTSDRTDPANVMFFNQNGDFIPALNAVTSTDDSIIYRIPLEMGETYDGSFLSFDVNIDCSEPAVNETFSYEIRLVTSTASTCASNCSFLVACENFGVATNCPGPCEGAAYRSYTVQRTNIGEFDMDDNGCPDDDNNCDNVPGDSSGAPPPPAPNIDSLALDRVIRGDTLETRLTFIIGDTLPRQGFPFLYVQDSLQQNLFSYLEATATVTRAAGPEITVDNVPNQSSGDLIRFDLSPSTFPGFVGIYERGDSLTFMATYVVGATNTTVATTYEIGNNIAASLVAKPNPAIPFQYDVEDFSCGEVAGTILVNDAIFTNNSNEDDLFNSCRAQDIVGSFSLRLSPSSLTGVNYFPNEYRNLFTVETVTASVPPGYEYFIARIRTQRTAGSGMSRNSRLFLPTPTTITERNGYQVYTFDFTQGPNAEFFESFAFPSDDSFNVLFDFFVNPTCEAGDRLTGGSATTRPSLTGTTFDGIQVTRLSNYIVEYNPPGYQVSTNEAVQIGRSRLVRWPLTVSNLSPVTPADNGWVSFNVPSGQIGNDSLSLSIVENGVITGTVEPDANGIYQLGDFDEGDVRQYLVTATYESCRRDRLQVFSGWDCSGYPTSTAGLTDRCIDTLVLGIQPERASLSLDITELADTPSDPSDGGSAPFGTDSVTICEPFPVELSIISGAQGFALNPRVIITNALGGGTPGLEYIVGSGTIEYPVGTPPRPFPAAADAALAGSPRQWDLTLSEIDPDNFGMDTEMALPGVTQIPLNQAILRFELQAGCDISSGERFTARAQGSEICGQRVRGFNERNLGFPINIEGVVNPYETDVSVTVTDTVAICTNEPLLISTRLIHIGSAVSSSNTDSVTVIVPNYLDATTDFSDIDCSTTFCPILPPVVVRRTDGLIEVKYALPSGMQNNDSLKFDLNVFFPDTLGCDFEVTQEVAVQTTVATSVFCDDIGRNCDNFQTITGGTATNFSTQKPVVSLDAIEINCIRDGSFIYTGEIQVDSFPLSAQNRFIVSLFCQDASTGELTLVDTTSVGGPVAEGDSITFTGAFPPGCDPDGQYRVLLDDADNCICSDAEEITMADKCPFPVVSGPQNGSTICGGRPIPLEVTILGDLPATGSWTTTGAGTIEALDSLSTVYRPVPSDGNRLLTFVFEIDDPEGQCPIEADSTTVTLLKVDCGSFPWEGNE